MNLPIAICGCARTPATVFSFEEPSMTACRIEDVPVAMCGREEVSMATCGREEVSMATWWHRETPMSMWKRVRLAAVVLMVVVGMLASPALGKKNVSSSK